MVVMYDCIIMFIVKESEAVNLVQLHKQHIRGREG